MKRPRQAPPHLKARIARIFYLAGLGCSAREIAEEMAMTRRHVYRLLAEYRISCSPKAPGQKSISLAISEAAFLDAHEIAGSLEMPPTWMMARLLETVLAERTVAVNLLDGVKAPE